VSGSAVASAIFAAVVLSMAAAGMLAVCWIAARGTLGRNSMAGLRTRAMLASEQAWETGHRAALPVMVVVAALTVIAAITSILVIGNIHAYLAAIVAAVLILLVGVVVATIIAGRAARNV